MSGWARRLLDLPLLVILMAISALAMLVPAAHAYALSQHDVGRPFFYSALILLMFTGMIALATANARPRDPRRSHLKALVGAYLVLPLMLAIPFHEAVPDTTFANAWFEMLSSFTTTGATLMANQLKEAAIVFESQAVLAAPAQPFGDARAELAAMLLRRLDAVLSVRASKLVLFQAARDAVPGLLKLLPDAEPPTVMAIEGQRDQVALQALCRSAMTWQRLEDMKRAGATGLLVLPVEQMLQ